MIKVLVQVNRGSSERCVYNGKLRNFIEGTNAAHPDVQFTVGRMLPLAEASRHIANSLIVD